MELSDLIKSIDIVEFISQYVELTQKGEEYWGLSCFKDEKTPSFSVRPDPPFFYDYSSGAGGNVYNFVRMYYHCSSAEAVEILKKYAGFDGEISSAHEKLDATIVCKRFQKKSTTEKAVKHLILPEKYMERYEKRADKLDVWRDEGISEQSLDRFQVYYDSFSDRLVYPIRNPSGEIVNIGGRTLDPEWKEKGLRKYTYFFGWGRMETIYGFSENLPYIKEKKEIILFEGCKSVLLADTWEIRNTGAILTSHLNPSQMKLLAKLGCRVVFALDKDVRIRDDKQIDQLKRYVNVEYIYDARDLLSEKDAPVDKGKEVFQILYGNRLVYR